MTVVLPPLSGSLGADPPDPVELSRGRARTWPHVPSFLIGGSIVAAVVVVAVVSVFWTPFDPLGVDPSHAFAGPGGVHLLGTDEYGRDVFSRLMAGSRVALYVGALSVAIAAVVGVPAGLLAAERGGAVGQVVLRLADVLYGFPALLAAIVLAAALGASKTTVTLAVGIAYIPVFIRVTRSNALGVLSSDYVLAARAYGRRPGAILRRHVVPNIATTMIAQMSLLFSLAVLAEAALDYLGLGTTAPAASWGTMLADGQNHLGNDALLTVWPSVALFVSVLGFSLLGEGLGELRDARSRR